jgi:hypothetical protein
MITGAMPRCALTMDGGVEHTAGEPSACRQRVHKKHDQLTPSSQDRGYFTSAL